MNIISVISELKEQEKVIRRELEILNLCLDKEGELKQYESRKNSLENEIAGLDKSLLILKVVVSNAEEAGKKSIDGFKANHDKLKEVIIKDYNDYKDEWEAKRILMVQREKDLSQSIREKTLTYNALNNQLKELNEELEKTFAKFKR